MKKQIVIFYNASDDFIFLGLHFHIIYKTG